jgi:hypothetical protein
MKDNRRRYTDEQIATWRRVWEKAKAEGKSSNGTAKVLGVCKYAFRYYTNPARKEYINRAVIERWKRLRNQPAYKEKQNEYVRRYQERVKKEEPGLWRERNKRKSQEHRNKLKQDPEKWRKYLDYVASRKKAPVDK